MENKTLFGLYCELRFGSKRKRMSVITRAVTPGVVPTPEDIKNTIAAMPLDSNMQKWLTNMDDFTTKLKDVSNKTDTNYTSNVEENAKAIVTFASAQYSKLRPGIPKATVDAMFDATRIGGTTQPNTNSLPRLASLLSKGNTAGFWDAVMYKVQGQRDKEQQVDDSVGMTVEEYNKAKDSYRTISAGFAFSSKKTQSLEYINGTSKAQKLEDSKAFSDWVKANENPHAAIIRLNLSDLPYSYAATELINFEKDQKDPARKQALKQKLNELKKDALKYVRDELKKNPNVNPDIRAWLETK